MRIVRSGTAILMLTILVAHLCDARLAAGQLFRPAAAAPAASPTLNRMSLYASPPAFQGGFMSSSTFSSPWRHRHRSTIVTSFGAGPLIAGSGVFAPGLAPCWSPYPMVFTGVVAVPVVVPPVLPVPQAVPVPFDPPDLAVPEPPRPKPTKSSTAEQKTTAGKYLGYGDANFAKQKYLAALERYKSGTRVAADVPELYFRQGFARLAMGQYASAAQDFRHGLKWRTHWANPPFALDQLYAGNKAAKISHLENLAKAVETNPFDSQAMVTLGVALFFDGQRDQADVCLTRAAQLGGNDDGLLTSVLSQKAGGAKADAPRGDGKVAF